MTPVNSRPPPSGRTASLARFTLAGFCSSSISICQNGLFDFSCSSRRSFSITLLIPLSRSPGSFICSQSSFPCAVRNSTSPPTVVADSVKPSDSLMSSHRPRPPSATSRRTSPVSLSWGFPYRCPGRLLGTGTPSCFGVCPS